MGINSDNETDKSHLIENSNCEDSQDHNDTIYEKWSCCRGQIGNCFCFGHPIGKYSDKCEIDCRKVKEDHWNSLEPYLSGFFNSLTYISIWLLIASIVGMIIFAASFYTMTDQHHVNPALVTCDSPFENYYMCPTCDRGCDFWYLRQNLGHIPCLRRFRLLLDNPLAWIYSFLVIVGALI